MDRLSGRFEREADSLKDASLVLYVHPEADEPELAFVIRIRDRLRKASVQAIVRATDGQILGRSVARE